MKKKSKSTEITSFNNEIADVFSLLELDDRALELVGGGGGSIECFYNDCTNNDDKFCVINKCGQNNPQQT